MKMKILVDDKDYDTQDGYTLISDNPYETGLAVKMAIENGFKDIRISEPSPEELLEFDKINQIEIGGVIL